MANYELISFSTADELARAAAGAWLNEIESANRAGKIHCVALSGGRIAQKFFTATVEQGRARKVSFARVHFFWADERCVPPADAESNFKLAHEFLLLPLNIATHQIHRLPGEIDPAAAVKLAEAEILQVVPANENKSPVLDLVLLGMGEDGHVASLFPNSPPAVMADDRCFLVVENSPKSPLRRISLSYAALANAGAVWVFVSGAGKVAALRESLAPAGNTPLARVLAARSGTRIFFDVRG